MASVESQGQGLQIGGLRQRRMDRVIGIGAGDPQDAAGAAGIGEPAAHRLGELRRADVERAGSDEEDAAARGHRGGEPRQLAVAAQPRRPLLARFGKGRGTPRQSPARARRFPATERLLPTYWSGGNVDF
jgi:hypothetical protein